MLSIHPGLTVWCLNGRIIWRHSTDRRAPTEVRSTTGPEGAAQRLLDHLRDSKQADESSALPGEHELTRVDDHSQMLVEDSGSKTVPTSPLSSGYNRSATAPCESRAELLLLFPPKEVEITSGEPELMHSKKADDRTPVPGRDYGNCCLQRQPDCQNFHEPRPESQETKDRKKLYRVEEVAPLISLGRTKVYEQIRLGRLKSVTIGRRRLIPAEYIDDFIGLLKQESHRPDSD